MAGYIRQSSAGIVTDHVIQASDLNAEFNAIQSAMSGTTGHVHDGTTGNGPKIALTTSVSGILPVSNGGTGVSSLTSGRVLVGAGTSGVSLTKAAPSGDFVGTTDAQTLTNKTLTSPTITGGTVTGITDITVADGGTGSSTAAGARTNLGLDASDILGYIKTVDGTASGLDADLLDGQHGSYYLPVSSYTASDVLTKLKTVDGAGSGVDSDLLDGQQGSYYTNASNISSGTISDARLPSTMSGKTFTDQVTGTTADFTRLQLGTGRVVSTGSAPVIISNIGTAASIYLRPAGENDTTNEMLLTSTGFSVGGQEIWHAGNDGAGSGLDADKLDGLSASTVDTANTIAQRDASGDSEFRLVKSTYPTTSQCAYFIGMNNFTTDNYHRPMTIAQASAALDSYLVPVGRILTAGSGLTGGGSLTANRTFTLGTPGTITNSSTNAVQTDSHTHALGFTAAEVYQGSGAADLNLPIGHVVFAGNNATKSMNANAVYPVYTDSTTGNRGWNYNTSGGSVLAGTWRCRGAFQDGGADNTNAVFQRVA